MTGAPIVQLTVLGSGSAGNATLVASGDARVLVDAGLSCRDLVRRLASLRPPLRGCAGDPGGPLQRGGRAGDPGGVDPASIGAIVITHAHGDHTRGAGLFSRKYNVPVYATSAVWTEWAEPDLAEWRPLALGCVTEVCGFRFLPFRVPHDAAETLAFRIETRDGAIGFATDIGSTPPELAARFRDCRVLVMESNHAADLLRVSPYAPPTRARIGSDYGHLSNEALAGFIRAHLGPGVRCLVLAHLSRVNNVAEIAELTCRAALVACGRTDVRLVVASQRQVSETIDVAAWAAPRPLASRISAQQVPLPFGN